MGQNLRMRSSRNHRECDGRSRGGDGVAGALRGIGAIPEDWVNVVDEATRNNPYTVSRRTIKEAADGLFAACAKEMQHMERALAELKTLAT